MSPSIATSPQHAVVQTQALSATQAHTRLSERFTQLAHALAQRPDALGLLALGSMGSTTAQVDVWSDLDFFVLVTPAAKAAYIQNLNWLAQAHPLVWHFQNTSDGHKALMADGVYCEFAVFEPAELARVPYSPGRWLWLRNPEPSNALHALANSTVAMPQARSAQWLLGEALSNLLVGLQRDWRGEHLAAMRLIQVYALDRVLELHELLHTQAPASRDPFAVERRIEARQPEHTPWLANAASGYRQNRQSAATLLGILQTLTPLPKAMVDAIEPLLAQP